MFGSYRKGSGRSQQTRRHLEEDPFASSGRIFKTLKYPGGDASICDLYFDGRGQHVLAALGISCHVTLHRAEAVMHAHTSLVDAATSNEHTPEVRLI
jgi:hypothetical protein